MRILLNFFLFMFLALPSAVFCQTFAQLALGGGYEATLFVSNKTDYSWAGRIYTKQGNDQRWATAWSINDIDCTGYSYGFIELGPKETGKYIIRGDSTTRGGYLELVGDGDASTLDVAVSYFYSYRTRGILTTLTGSGISKVSDQLYFPAERSIADGINTGFAIAPFINTGPFQVKMTAYDYEGNRIASKTWQFDGYRAGFLNDASLGFGNALPAEFIGHVIVEADDWVALEVLRMENTPTGFLLTSTPADDLVPF
jgi:hypothetical protein